MENYIIREDFSLNGSSTILFDGEEGNVVANINRDLAYIVGCTFTLKGNISNYFKTKASFTYTKGKAYDTKEPLSSIPPLFGMLEFSYEKQKFETIIDVKFNGVKKLKNYNLSEGIDNIEQTPLITETGEYYGSPSWATLNFSTKYRLTENLDLRVSVDNIFDQHYKEFASGISAPGLNFSISILSNF